MRADVKKRPTYLVALIENRARAANEEERLRMVLRDLGKELAHAKRRVQAYDLAIKDYNPLLDASAIKSVNACRTGKRGNLSKAVDEVLDQNAGTWLSTAEITAAVEQKLGMHFHSADARARWSHNSVGKQLKKRVRQGFAERMADDDAATVSGVGARWRRKSDDGPSLARLSEQAAAVGGSVRVPDAARE